MADELALEGGLQYLAITRVGVAFAYVGIGSTFYRLRVFRS